MNDDSPPVEGCPVGRGGLSSKEHFVPVSSLYETNILPFFKPRCLHFLNLFLQYYLYCLIYPRIQDADRLKINLIPLVTKTASSLPPLFPYFYAIMDILYHNLYTHFVFITQDRYPAIISIHRERVEKYITGTVNNNQCKLYAIYANPEHVHFLVSRDPSISERELAKLVASATEKFINSNNLCNGKFYWQSSCSAFSVSKKEVDRVCKYILNQPVHHQKHTFAEEYDVMLKHYQEALKKK